MFFLSSEVSFQWKSNLSEVFSIHLFCAYVDEKYRSVTVSLFNLLKVYHIYSKYQHFHSKRVEVVFILKRSMSIFQDIETGLMLLVIGENFPQGKSLISGFFYV